LLRLVGHQYRKESAVADRVVVNPPAPPMPLVVVKQPRKKQKRTGHLEIEGRDTVKDMKSGAEILELMKSMVIPEMKELNEKARQWVIKALNPVLRCLNNHFNGDTEQFLSKYGDENRSRLFATSRFYKVCKGDNESCLSL
jgi:hypothetical protein